MAERRRVYALLILPLLVLGALYVATTRLMSRRAHQRVAVEYLTEGRRNAAEPHLVAMRGGTIWIPVVSKPEVAKRLFARGAYEDFLAYDAASRELRDSAEAKRARAHAKLAVERAEAERRAGRYESYFDRDGRRMAPLVRPAEAGRYVHEQIYTTIDPEVQRAADAALGGLRGSLVAIDPRTNEVLAVVGEGALEKQYEPGSVIKVITLLAALANGVDVKSMFPYTCKGALKIDGRSFGDWREGGHGVLPDVEEALAQSCNVVFADIGLRVGRDRLQQLHKRAGFDGRTNLGLLQLPLGRTIGTIYNNFETGFYSIGLEHESVTTFHLAMLASMLANRGALTTPRLVRARKTIVGDAIGELPKQSTDQIAPRESVETLVRGMRAVVERPRGTGRRAAIEGITLALKTGTSGTREGGYDAVILGFAPAENPKIAFAAIAENAGPAELAAAKIAKELLVRLKPRL